MMLFYCYPFAYCHEAWPKIMQNAKQETENRKKQNKLDQQKFFTSHYELKISDSNHYSGVELRLFNRIYPYLAHIWTVSHNNRSSHQ